MPEKKPRRLVRIIGYVSFVILSLIVGFFVTFPYDALQERLRIEANQAGYTLGIRSVGPGFLGLRASGVQVSAKPVGDAKAEPIQLDSVAVGPSLFPPGLSIRAKGLGGAVTATVAGISGLRLKVDATGLDLSRGNVKGFSGIDFSGVVDAHLDVSLPRGGSGASAAPDLSQASGTLSLETKDLAINGGTVTVPIAQFGPEPTPLDLPKIVLGAINAKVKIVQGAATVEDFRAKSPDLEASASGTMKLGNRLEYTESNLEVRFKPDPEFQKRLGLIGSALSIVGADPKDPTWRLGHLTGFLGRPQFR